METMEVDKEGKDVTTEKKGEQKPMMEKLEPGGGGQGVKW